eukprot:Hpha_TRINITY_DN15939_c0_g1::TRINITY_DN15939_c0_g1_i5::g.71670::m.71670
MASSFPEFSFSSGRFFGSLEKKTENSAPSSSTRHTRLLCYHMTHLSFRKRGKKKERSLFPVLLSGVFPRPAPVSSSLATSRGARFFFDARRRQKKEEKAEFLSGPQTFRQKKKRFKCGSKKGWCFRTLR